MGLPGTGKSTTSRVIQEIIDKDNCILINSDITRDNFVEKKYFELNKTKKGSVKQRTYELMFAQAKDFFSKGKSVIIDAMFHEQNTRDLALKSLGEKNCTILEIICSDEKLLEKRIEKRRSEGKDSSTAGFDIYLQFKPQWEKIIGNKITIDSKYDIKNQINMLLEKL